MNANNNPFRLGKQYLKNYCLLTTYYDGTITTDTSGRTVYLKGNSIFNSEKKPKPGMNYKVKNLNIGVGSYFEIIRKRSSSYKALSTKLGRIASSEYHLLVIFKLNDDKGWASFGFGPDGALSPDPFLFKECNKLYSQEQKNTAILNSSKKLQKLNDEDLLKLRKKYKTNLPSSKLRQTRKYRKWRKDNPNANSTNFYRSGDDTISVIANGILNQGQLNRLLTIINHSTDFSMLLSPQYLKKQIRLNTGIREKAIEHNCTSSLLFIFSDVITNRKALGWISPAYVKKQNNHENVEFQTREIFNNNLPFLMKEFSVFNNRFFGLKQILVNIVASIGICYTNKLSEAEFQKKRLPKPVHLKPN